MENERELNFYWAAEDALLSVTATMIVLPLAILLVAGIICVGILIWTF